jgi:signal peptidase II
LSARPSPQPRLFALYLLLGAAVLLLDQVTKAIVAREIPLNDAIPVIPGFFSISHVLNSGAAFSLFADYRAEYARVGLISFSVVVIGVIAFVLWISSYQRSRMNLAMAFILGGAFGNLVDRLTIGSVVDFLAFQIGSYHWPDFNVADSAIVCGSLLLIVDSLFSRHEQRNPATN